MQEDQSKKIEKLESELVSLRLKVRRIEDYIESMPRFEDFINKEKFTDSDEPLFEDAVKIVNQCESTNSSSLQRRLCIGYARASRIIDLMVDKDIVGPAEGTKPRKVNHEAAENYLQSLSSEDN